MGTWLTAVAGDAERLAAGAGRTMSVREAQGERQGCSSTTTARSGQRWPRRAASAAKRSTRPAARRNQRPKSSTVSTQVSRVRNGDSASIEVRPSSCVPGFDPRPMAPSARSSRDLVALRLNPWWYPHDLYTLPNDGSGGPFTIGRVIHSSRSVGFTGWIGGVAVFNRSFECRGVGEAVCDSERGACIFANAVTRARRLSGSRAVTVDRKIGDKRMGTKADNPPLFLSTVFLSAIQPREH